MDEIAILASIGSALLAGTAGVLWGRGTVWDADNMTLNASSRQLETFDSAHEHAAGTFDNTGWHCECGKHMHSFMFNVEDSDDKRCVCGKTGTGKEWS